MMQILVGLSETITEGKAGDWLVQYDDAGQDFGIVGRALFEQTYQHLEVTPELRNKLAAMRGRPGG